MKRGSLRVLLGAAPGVGKTYEMLEEGRRLLSEGLDVVIAIVETHGRHDPCVGIRATPIAEAMLALVLIDHALRHRAQNADVVVATQPIPGSVSGLRSGPAS